MCPNNGVRFGAYLLRVSMGTEGRELCRRQEQTGKVLAGPRLQTDLKGTWCVQGLFVKQILNSHSNVLRGNRNAGDSVSHGAVSSSVPALWRPWVPPPGGAELTRTGSRVS